MGKKSREKRERKILKEKEEVFKETALSLFLLKIIKVGTYLILFTPLIVSANFFFPFVGPKSLYFMGLTQIIFFCWLILIIFNPKYRPKFNLLLLALIFYLAILILTSILGANFSSSFWSKYERMTGLLMHFHLFGFFLTISSVFKKEDWQKVFLVSILVAAILGSLSFFSQEIELLKHARGGSTIGNSSFMGVYLLFNIFLGIYLIWENSLKENWKIFSGILIFIIILALFLSDARAAILSFLGGIILIFFLYLALAIKNNYLKILGKTLLFFSFLIFLISCFLLFQKGSFLQEKFIQLATKARLIVWQIAWQGFLEKPFFGWGPENFEVPFAKYFHPCLFLSECGGEIWFDRAHNIILDTLINSGILGLLSYLFIFFSIFLILWKGFFQKKFNFWLVSIFSTILISYFLQNLTVFDMVNSYLMFFLVLGFLASLKTSEKPISLEKSFNKNFPQFQKILILILFFLFFLSFFKFIIQPLRADYFAVKSMEIPLSQKWLSFYKDYLKADPTKKSQIEAKYSPLIKNVETKIIQLPQKRLSLCQKTLKTSPLGKYQLREYFAENILRFYQNEIAKKVSQKDFQAEFEFIISELKKSIKEFPINYRFYLQLGQILNFYGRFYPEKLKEAEEILKKAIELSPSNPQTFWYLAETKFYLNEKKEALSLAEKAIKLEPKIKQSHWLAIQIAKALGDKNLVKEKVEKAIKINPSWEKEFKKFLE
jgi:O-antigen ligase